MGCEIAKLTDYAINADIRSLIGVPSWMLVLLKKITKDTGQSITDIWPNLEVFYHGGVSFAPYREQFEKLIPLQNELLGDVQCIGRFFGIQYTPTLLICCFC